MSKRLAIVFCLIFTIGLLCLPAQAFAVGSVTYDGSARTFTFTSGTASYPTDLFPDFKNLVPGDSLEEQVVINNSVASSKKIKVYLRAAESTESVDDFLSQIKMTVVKQDGSVIFDGTADDNAQLENWVYLGTVQRGGFLSMKVTVELPTTMGDEYQNAQGYVNWEFMVEEIDSRYPQTGDTGGIFIYSALMLTSLAALTAVIFAHRRKED